MDDVIRTRVEIEVDDELLQRARDTGLDVQRVAERALRDELVRRGGHLSRAEREDLRERTRREIRADVVFINAHVEKHGLLSDEWR